jgi:hypothetical protein
MGSVRVTGYAEVIPIYSTAPLLPGCGQYVQNIVRANNTSKSRVHTASETDIRDGSYQGPRGLILSGEQRPRYSPKGAQLLQFGVFGFGRDEDGNVGIGILPQCKEILIGSTRSDGVAL